MSSHFQVTKGGKDLIRSEIGNAIRININSNGYSGLSALWGGETIQDRLHQCWRAPEIRFS